MTTTAKAASTASGDDCVIAHWRAEVAWWEDFLEALQTVPGSYRDWDDQMQGPDRQEKCCEEVQEVLRHAQERLAAALGCVTCGSMPGAPDGSAASVATSS
jgi:hypothetical protein